jgi:hypothetical protein
LLDKLSQQDLIIGFEITPALRRFLNDNQQRYINLYVHPVRFLRDLCFGATTNCPAIASLLKANTCDPVEIIRQVRRFSALFSRLQLPACSLPDGVPLLIGQTACDSVLLNKGTFARWENYQELLKDELAPFDTVAFIEHPYRPSSTSIVEFLRSSLAKNVISVRGNSYGLLFTNREAPVVITLASSLGVEAETIGFQTKFLLADPRAKFVIPDIEQTGMPMLGHAVLDAQFWNGVIRQEPVVSNSVSMTNSFFMGEHYLRNSLDTWSYKNLQYSLSVEPSVKTIVPSYSLQQERLGNLAEQCSDKWYAKVMTLGQSVANARSKGIDLRILDKPIAPGEKWDLPINKAEGKHYLRNGFHPPENWGVWSSERHSALVIPLVANGVEVACVGIEMEFTLYEGAGRNSPALKLSTDSRDIGYILFRPSNMHLQKVAFEILTCQPILQLNFEITDLRSPSETLGTPDTRKLGFGLKRVSVNYLSKPRDEASIEDNEGLFIWGIDPDRAIQCSDVSQGLECVLNHANHMTVDTRSSIEK